MNTLSSKLLRIVGCLALVVSTAFSQGAPKGTFVLSQSGNVSATLASLTFAADGSFTGTEVVQNGGPIATYSLQGTYVLNTDNSKTLAIFGTSVDAVDVNGDPLTLSETLKLIPVAGDSFVTLRMDPGQYVRGYLTPAVASIPAGDYVLSGKSLDPASTSVELVSLDNAGNVSGREVVNSFGTILERPLSGAYAATAEGFQKITLNVSSVDADGNPLTTTETYLALATAKDIKMIQIDGAAAGLLLLSK